MLPLEHDEQMQKRLAVEACVERRLQAMTPQEREEFNRLMKYNTAANPTAKSKPHEQVEKRIRQQ